MRWILVAIALGAAAPLHAQSGVAVQSAVFVERSDAAGSNVRAADRFTSGDQILTVMTWQAADRSSARIVSAVPAGLELQSVSRDGVEYSTDGGRTWRTAGDGRQLPHGVTHLRWRTGGDGRLSYRAVMR